MVPDLWQPDDDILKVILGIYNDLDEVKSAFEKMQILQLRAKVLQAEQERLDGVETISVSEARKRLRERADVI